MRWCLVSESNQGHNDFQSFALPTELTRHIKYLRGRNNNLRGVTLNLKLGEFFEFLASFPI